NSLSREEFLKHAWEWKEKHGGIILEQLKKLGASCDWQRTCFTMDEIRSESVLRVFVDLYNKGLIYRGVRMVNWDPAAQTAVSDEEVIYTDEQSKLYYVRYTIEGSSDYIVVATTRPETILGDTAVCVNPNDPRYTHLKGKRVIVPMVNRSVPVVFDTYVDMEFGTGCLKITPAHDMNDYTIGQKHKLDSIDIFNANGTLSEAAGLFVGQDRFEARLSAEKLLSETGAMHKIENYNNKVGRSERTGSVIEPKISTQWFLSMEKLAKPALDAVMSDEVKLHPPKFKNVYRHWMENVRDWCISRQLWWGHRIPAWYLPGGNDFVVALSESDALELARKKSGNPNLNLNDLHQDEDVLDTWFSSWLWPISVFDGICHPDNPDIRYYYPTNDLITAPEILFFWVARMIIAGYEYRDEKPFSNVYLTGIVRDGLGRKMSKSLGNSPDPLKLIEKYSADGVRVGMLLCSAAGNDLLFDMKIDESTGEEVYALPEQGRNFANKIWNAFRLVKSWNIDENETQPDAAKAANEWFTHRFAQELATLNQQFDSFRLSEALMTVYKLFWDDFSAWLLELVKPAYGKGIDTISYNQTVAHFENMLKLLHPFMPFITEEVWQQINQRSAGDSIMVAEWPANFEFSQQLVDQFDYARELVAAIRNIRQSKNISPREQLTLSAAVNTQLAESMKPVVMKLAAISEIQFDGNKPDGAAGLLVKNDEYFLALGNLINKDEEIAKLKTELEYTQGFLNSVLCKLQNEKFVSGAPEAVVAGERKKQADAEAKIVLLNRQIEELSR
ncbi:MAG: valine--tRNA ligase, partial [Bacteroidales bacterium]|nr:valine--tRNA ligase [Bacteroidales bacterium]